MESRKLKPDTKVQAGINFGALATIGIGLFAVFYPDLYDRFPPALEGAMVGFVVSFAAYMKKNA